MAEERVVLTATLQDEASAPLGALSKEVAGASKKVAKASGDQADAVAAAGKKIAGATGTVSKDMGAMASAAGKASGKTSSAVEEAANKIKRSGGQMGAAAKRAGEEAGSSMASGFSSKVKGLAAGAVAALGISKLGGLASSAVSTFSELEDSSAAASVVFGKNIGQITTLAAGAGEALGLSQQQVVSAATTYGSYGKMAGKSGKELADFASENTALAADLASFWGKSPEQAIEAIGAAYRGEAEPMRAFGVMIDENALKNEAMKQGLISSTKDALTPANKVLATQALIMKSTADAQGDFARTADSTANVQKRLQVATTNLSAKIGGFLAPMFTAARLKALGVVNAISAFLDRITAAQKAIKGGALSGDIAKVLGFGPGTTAVIAEVIGAVRAFKAAYYDGGEVTSSGVAGAFERAGDIVGRVVAGWTLAGQDIKLIGDDIDPLVRKIYDLRQMVGGFGPAQWAGVAGGAGLLLASFGKLRPFLAPMLGIFARFGPVLAQMGGALKFLLGPIGLIAGLMIYAYATNAQFRDSINGLVTMLLSLAGTLLSQLMPVFMTLVTTLLPVISQLFAQLVPVLIQVLNAVVPLIPVLLAQLLPVFTQLITTVLPILVGLIATLAPVFLQVVSAVLPVVGLLIGQLVPVLLQMITAVLPIVMGLLTQLAPVFMSLLSAILPILPPVMSLVTTLLGLAMQVITPLMPIISMLAGLFGTVLGGAIQILMPIVKFLLEAFTNLVNFLKGPLETALGVVKGIFETLGGIIKGVLDGIGDFMSNPLGGIQDMLGIPKDSGGGVHASGGAVMMSGGGIVPGYAPGVDNIPAILSRGESVLVPELTRAIGPRNIMAMNREYSGGRPAGAGPSPAPRAGFQERLATPPAPVAVPVPGGGSVTYEVNITVDGSKDPRAAAAEIKRVLAELAEEERRRSYA